MRSSLSVFLLLSAALVLPGCVNLETPGAEVEPSAAEAAVPFPPLPDGAAPFTHLLCEGDALLPLTDDRADGCNFHATPESGPAAEVHLAVNPLDPMNLVGGSKDFTLGEDERCGKYNVWSGVHVSFDGGRTWEHSLLPGHPGDERETALSQYACGSDPVLVFGPEGTVYYVSIHYTDDPDMKPPLPQLGPIWGGNSVNAGLAVTRSLDGGRTWEDPVILAHKEDGDILDKEWAAVDMATGAVYVTYIDTGNGEFHVQRSDDGGLTWTEPVSIVDWSDDGSDGPEGGQFGQVAVDPEGVVHFTYWGEGSNDDLSAIYHQSSSDRGMTWSEPHKVAAYYPVFDLEFTHKYRIVPNPALAASPVDGTLYVGYPFYVAPESDDAPAGGLDAYVVRSTDGGATWDAPVRVNDELAAPLNGQWMQALAVGPDGTVHTTWLDYRDDPTGENAYVYYAHSKDQGRTWSANARVSDVPFDGTGGYHQSGAGTIGDYMGLAVSEDAVYPFWADTRFGRNDVFAAVLPS